MDFKNVSKVNVYVSMVSDACQEIINYITSTGLPVSLVRLDTPEVRKIAMTHPVHPVKSVPTLCCIKKNGVIQMFSSADKVMRWLTMYSSFLSPGVIINPDLSSDDEEVMKKQKKKKNVHIEEENNEVVVLNPNLDDDDDNVVTEIPPPPSVKGFELGKKDAGGSMSDLVMKAKQMEEAAKKITPGLNEKRRPMYK